MIRTYQCVSQHHHSSQQLQSPFTVPITPRSAPFRLRSDQIYRLSTDPLDTVARMRPTRADSVAPHAPHERRFRCAPYAGAPHTRARSDPIYRSARYRCTHAPHARRFRCAPRAPIPLPHMRVRPTRGHDSLWFVCLLCTRPHFVYNVRLHSTEPPVGGGNSVCRVPVLSTCACSPKRPSACVLDVSVRRVLGAS